MINYGDKYRIIKVKNTVTDTKMYEVQVYNKPIKLLFLTLCKGGWYSYKFFDEPYRFKKLSQAKGFLEYKIEENKDTWLYLE